LPFTFYSHSYFFKVSFICGGDGGDDDGGLNVFFLFFKEI
jgi:hypothetical protein